MSAKILPGKYLHYKNKYYEVIGEATHTETEETFVVYYELGEDGQRKELFVRPKKMFEEKVIVNSGAVPRFKFVSKLQ